MSSTRPSPSLVFFRSGLVVRVLLAVVCGGAALFIATMSFWTTENSWLACQSPSNGTTRCTIRKEFPFGIAFEDVFSPVQAARTERRVDHDRYGEHPYRVLLLDSPAAPLAEFPGVGTNGENAQEVADGANAFSPGLDPQGDGICASRHRPW